jgi:hypothetical protein
MIPQFVGIIEFPRGSGFIINFIDDCDGGCIWLILGCVLSNDCLKHLPEHWGFLIESGKVVDIVQEASGKIREAAVCGRGDEVIDGIPEGVDVRIPESCFMSLAKVMQCDWVLRK